MTHGSLFNGIGGFQLAAGWMGWTNVFSCEIDKFCNKVTKHHFPNCIQHEDIKTTDFSIYRGRIDIVTGGFPCQPYSTAGKRKGKEDERHLWPEMLRAIREIQPGWVVGENVPGLLNWERGMVLDEIKADLEAAGFEVFPPLVLPACSKNAPHRRDRLWVVAHALSTGKRELQSIITREDETEIRCKNSCGLKSIIGNGYALNTNEVGLPNQEQITELGWLRFSEYDFGDTWAQFPTQSPVCNGNDGFPLDLADSTLSESKWRTESIKALGNAIVPQVAFEIFKAIELTNQTL